MIRSDVRRAITRRTHISFTCTSASPVRLPRPAALHMRLSPSPAHIIYVLNERCMYAKHPCAISHETFSDEDTGAQNSHGPRRGGGKKKTSPKESFAFILPSVSFLVALFSSDRRVSFSRSTESFISLQLQKHSVALTAYCEHISAIPASTHSPCKSIFLFAARRLFRMRRAFSSLDAKAFAS